MQILGRTAHVPRPPHRPCGNLQYELAPHAALLVHGTPASDETDSPVTSDSALGASGERTVASSAMPASPQPSPVTAMSQDQRQKFFMRSSLVLSKMEAPSPPRQAEPEKPAGLPRATIPAQGQFRVTEGSVIVPQT